MLRAEDGSVCGIVEDAMAGPREKDLGEINVGVYCFSASWVWTYLSHLPISPTGEYFITDLIAIASQSGMNVESVALKASEEGMGINDRVQLAKAEAILRHRIRERLMLAGVTILDRSSTFIDAQVEIGQDTVIYPNTTISGGSKIGERCHVGPNSIVIDSTIGSGCRVISSMIESSVLEEDVEVGPFSHIRPESYIGAETHIGNYAEVKKSRLGRGVAMGHFSYIGDAQVGNNVNISAGAITCNFDGVEKHETVIGNDAFIGCDTMMVAPVTIGDRAYTGAGAVVIHDRAYTGAGTVVIHDVPPDTLVAGVPARVLRKLDPKIPETT
ncbi:MAG: Bifunctional protein GlmU [Dehalococcoidia bacterium]|nr:Bifunctional protein GlmU [Dehalococcoidia bacterium]